MHAEIEFPVLTIQPTKGWGRLGLRDIWEYRDLLYFLLWRDVKGRYKQMALGPLWIVLHPILNMAIFTVIFGMVAKLPTDGAPYPVFAYTALLPWTFFSSAVMGAGCLSVDVIERGTPDGTSTVYVDEALDMDASGTEPVADAEGTTSSEPEPVPSADVRFTDDELKLNAREHPNGVKRCPCPRGILR